MAVDIQALKAPPPEDKRAEELLALCRSQLSGDWRLVSASVKLSKAIFEADYEGRRVIGKVSGSRRAQTAFGSLNALWSAGMRPPSEFTVPEPIAWFEDRKLLVLEKAPGESIMDCLERGRDAEVYVRQAAKWLECLQNLGLSLREEHFNVEAAETRAAELVAAIDDPRIGPAAESVIERLKERSLAVVPSHGDFHPMNIYVAPDRITAIDLDTVALREKEADIGYFVAQLANFGLLMFDSLAETRRLREVFLNSFSGVDERRLYAHIAGAMLQSLHYDACILKIKNNKAGLMVEAARKVLDTGSLDPAGQ